MVTGLTRLALIETRCVNTAMDAFAVRPATEDDGMALVELREQWRLESHQVALGSDPTFPARFLAWFRSERAAGSLAWVAEDVRVIGMLVMFVHERMPEPGRPTTSWGYIGNLFVHPDRRDAGTGAALLSAAIDDAKRRKLARLVLNPSPRSVPLYERAGFNREHGLLTLDFD